MDCYNAAKEGKIIYKKIKHYDYIENSYEYEEIDFLNTNMHEIIKPDTENENYEYIIQNW